MIIIGIDYSLNSPAMTIKLHDKIIFYIVQSIHKKYEIKKDIGDNIQIECIYMHKSDCTGPEVRYNTISDYFIEFLKKISQDHKVGDIHIEDYAYAGNGQVFQIAENTGLLKHKLWKTFGKVLKYNSPSTIKKMATGKGTAGKIEMADAFYKVFGFNPHDIFGCIKGSSPASDLIDSYFIQASGVTTNYSKEYMPCIKKNNRKSRPAISKEERKELKEQQAEIKKARKIKFLVKKTIATARRLDHNCLIK